MSDQPKRETNREIAEQVLPKTSDRQPPYASQMDIILVAAGREAADRDIDPWGGYLKARMRLIASLMDEQNCLDDIYQTLLVDTGQVALLMQTVRDERFKSSKP